MLCSQAPYKDQGFFKPFDCAQFSEDAEQLLFPVIECVCKQANPHVVYSHTKLRVLVPDDETDSLEMGGLYGGRIIIGSPIDAIIHYNDAVAIDDEDVTDTHMLEFILKKRARAAGMNCGDDDDKNELPQVPLASCHEALEKYSDRIFERLKASVCKVFGQDVKIQHSPQRIMCSDDDESELLRGGYAGGFINVFIRGNTQTLTQTVLRIDYQDMTVVLAYVTLNQRERSDTDYNRGPVRHSFSSSKELEDLLTREYLPVYEEYMNLQASTEMCDTLNTWLDQAEQTILALPKITIDLKSIASLERTVHSGNPMYALVHPNPTWSTPSCHKRNVANLALLELCQQARDTARFDLDRASFLENLAGWRNIIAERRKTLTKMDQAE